MIRLFFKTVLIIISIGLIPINHGACADMTSPAAYLPDTLGDWTRSESVRVINSETIFEYMNGAGELYLSYGFEHLEVVEYKHPDQAGISVEIYIMKRPEDAFGLLSLDWGGEPVETPLFAPSSGKVLKAPPHRALYGAGLLRMAVDSLYVRILSYRETPVIRKAILSLGRSVSENRRPCPEPELLKRVPLKLASGHQLRKDRVGYFRSYLVLNSLYYISHQNILNLDHSTRAVFAPFELNIDAKTKKRIQFLLVQYPDEKKASLALEKFHMAYLPEFSEQFKKQGDAVKSNSFEIEEGVMGYQLDGTNLSLLFDLPDLQSAESIFRSMSGKY